MGRMLAPAASRYRQCIVLAVRVGLTRASFFSPPRPSRRVPSDAWNCRGQCLPGRSRRIAAAGGWDLISRWGRRPCWLHGAFIARAFEPARAARSCMSETAQSTRAALIPVSEGTRRDGRGPAKSQLLVSQTSAAEKTCRAIAGFRTRKHWPRSHHGFSSRFHEFATGSAAQPGIASCEFKTLHTNRKRRPAAR